jgi:peroxiredoxin
MLRLLFTAALLCLPLAAEASPRIGAPAPDFTGISETGEPVALSSYKGGIVVLEWHNPNCPFVRKHYGSGNMQKLQTEAHDDGITWLTINSNSPSREGSLTPAQATQYIKEHGMRVTHYIVDPEGTIGRLYGAKSTPTMAVIDKDGTLVYLGAIDDKPTANQSDIPIAQNYVRAALVSLKTGTPIAVTSTQAYGCSVKY